MNRHLTPALLAVAVAACGHAAADDKSAAEPPAATFTVQEEPLTTVVPVEGTVVARRTAEISTRMMARITAVPVEVGDRVREGQTLVRLGTDDVAANRLKAEAAVRAAQAARDEAARQAARMDTLYAQDVVAQVQRDGAQLGLAQAESQLALAKATLQEVETAASYATIAAPFAGSVVRRFADEGDVASPGMPILILEDTGERDAVVAVPVDLAAGLRADMPIRVTTTDGRAGTAIVRAVAAGADPMTRTVEVRATLPAEWPTGTAVTALVPAGSHEGIAIPAHAVVRRGQLTGVRVVTVNGVTIRWVRLGRTLDSGEQVQVLSGLEPGDRIVL
ncbi:MAG: efflux RND transporter periplasmic adaptor subunit [Gemmatimonadota bacterium]|nr:MAG: efflux RND transporter periplasmic adaptor subunit [Gemmatimonadota bacterium]